MVRKLVALMLVAVLVVLAVPSAPAAAQETTRLVLPGSALQEALNAYMPPVLGLNFEEIVWGFGAVSVQENGVLIEAQLDVENTESVIATGNLTPGGWDITHAWPLRVGLAPVVNDGRVVWQIGLFELSDGAGTPVELTQEGRRFFVDSVRTAWRGAFIEVMRSEALAAFPEGLQGSPVVTGLSLNYTTVEIVVDVTIDDSEPTRDGSGLVLGGPFNSVVAVDYPDGMGALPTRSGGEGESIVITQDDFNRAFARVAASYDQLEHLSVAFGTGGVIFSVQSAGLCNNEVVEMAFELTEFTLQDTPEQISFDNLLRFQGATCGDERVSGPEVPSLLQFEIQMIIRSFARTVWQAVGGMTITGVQQGEDVQSLIIFF